MRRVILPLLCSLVSFELSASKLVIISPHRKSVQDEFMPMFQKHYESTYKKPILIEWIDQGGATNDLKFILSRVGKQPLDIDIFWGGGEMVFQELEDKNLLESVSLNENLLKELPSTLQGLSLRSKKNTWFSSAVNSFGIFYNKPLLAMQKISEPKTWSDLAKPEFFGKVSIADPRHSSSSLMINLIMLYSDPWETSWANMTAIAANAKSFTHSSSDPIKAVVSGDVCAATAVDYYATAKMAELGSKNLGFVFPAKKTVFNNDPIAVLKGATNLLEAKRFVEFILSKEAQRILFLPKGHPKGPVQSDIGRIAVNKMAYEKVEYAGMNPFLSLPPSDFQLDEKKLLKIRNVVADLIGAVFIDSHKELKQAWGKMMATKTESKYMKEFTKPFVSQQELLEFSVKWDNNFFRNEQINKWVKEAHNRFQAKNS